MKFINYLICATFVIAFCAGLDRAQTYQNPVIAGDFPDPSVIRVGEDYYAAATTGGWSPHFPILHSKDLVNWKIVGSVFDKKPDWIKNDFWAPELIVDKGRFFVYYTARRDDGKGKKGTLCVAVAVADKPDGKWTDKGALVCQEMGSLDGFFIRDENDKPYLIWKEDGNDRGQPTWIYAQGLDESGTKLLGKPKKMFRNTEPWEKHVIEGSFIMRRGDYFYHFYSGNACCGRSCDYALGVARSKTLLGKWEKYAKNPILAENEIWQCPGHGSIVRTPDGADYLLYHAYRNRSDAFNIGREALLDKIEWTADGWAAINQGRGASDTAAVPSANFKQTPVASFLDEFTEKQIEPKWNYPLENDQSILLENGFVKIAPTAKQLAIEKMPETILAERTVSGTYTAETRLVFQNIEKNEFAGLSAYSWRGNALGISFGDGKIFVWRREEGKQTETGVIQSPATNGVLHLKMIAQGGEIFRFAWSADGEKWTEIGGKVFGSHVEGARIALIYNAAKSNPAVQFDWLKVNNEK